MSDLLRNPIQVRDGWLLRGWAESLAEVIQAMTGEELKVDLESPGGETDDAVSWWEQDIDLADGASLWIGADDAVRRALGQKVLVASGVEDGSDEDIEDTYRELIQQALAGVAARITSEAGSETNCTEGRQSAEPPPWTNARLILDPESETPLAVWCNCSPPVAAALSSTGAPQPQPSPPELDSSPVTPAAEPATGTPAALVASDSSPRTIDLLLDVELPVSISFGRAHLPLRDVIKLTSGSIVELNRSVSEPVEVIVNNCVVARGEVVVVEGNYGVRIGQIISRQERLRTLN